MKTEEKKARLKFVSRLSPKTPGSISEDVDLGMPISSELQIRMPVIVAAGRTTSAPKM